MKTTVHCENEYLKLKIKISLHIGNWPLEYDVFNIHLYYCSVVLFYNPV